MKGLSALLKDGALNRLSVDEIMEFGYPREVAERIASGELSMDEASRAARSENFSPVLYRGHDYDFPPTSDADMWMTDNPEVAETYWQTVTPLRHNAKDLLNIDGQGMGYEDLNLEPWHVPGIDWDAYDGALEGTDGISYAVKFEGNRQGTRFHNLIDDYEYDEFSPESTVDNVLGSRPDVQIRHRDAAYDPEYNGPNIMGATAAGAVGLGALAESEDAEAISMGTGAKNAPFDMLGMAKTMRHRGLGEEEVFEKTGWWQGTDGNWRWELADENFYQPVDDVIRQGSVPGGKWEGRQTTKGRWLGYDYDGNRIGWNFNPRGVQNLTGGDLLLENYPALGAIEMPITRVPDPATMSTGNGGSFYGVGAGGVYPDEGAGLNSFTPAVTPNWSPGVHRYSAVSDGRYFRPPTLKVNQIHAPIRTVPKAVQDQGVTGADDALNRAKDQYASTMAHELQHAIQDLEGWGQGAGSNAGKRVGDASAYNEQKLLWDYGESTFETDGLVDEFDRLTNKWMDLDTKVGGDYEGAPQHLVDQLKKVDGELEYINLMYPYVREASIARAQAEKRNLDKDRLSEHQAYLNTSGEVEARNTQARRKLTDETRRSNPPWRTQDTPESDQTAVAYAQSPTNDAIGSWQPMRERLVKAGVLMPDYERDVLDLQREGMSESAAWNLVMPQYRMDRETIEQNLENFLKFKGAAPEQRQEMLYEAERVRAAERPFNRTTPFADQYRNKAAAALVGAAAANANAASAEEEPGVLEELYNNSYAGQQAQELGEIITDAGIQQMVDSAGELGFTPVVNDYSGALWDMAQSRNELNETARSIYINGAADATEPTLGNRVADALEYAGLYEDNPTAAESTGDTLATIAELGYGMSNLGYLASVPDAIAQAQQNIATDGGSFDDYLTLGLESVTGGIGRSTIRGAYRKLKPGIYQDTPALLEQAGAQVAPESAALPDVFGVTRQDLYDIGSTRQGNLIDYQPPAAVANPRGSLHAEAVMKPANTRRLVDLLEQARGTDLEKGMVGWYVMDPAYQALRSLGLSEQDALDQFSKFQNFTGIMSANADVMTELNRGTGALYMHDQGRMDEWWKHGGNVRLTGGPEDMMRIHGHPGHTTSHGKPLQRLLDTGVLSMTSPKVPSYIAAAGIPETGFQTNFSVGDAHFVRGIALADARPPRPKTGDKTIGESWSMSEAQTLAPWWREDVAAQAGYESVPAQATIWGALGPQTGVETDIGAPKLEILANMIAFRAKERGISIEQARDEILMGKDYLSVLPSGWNYER